MKTSILLFLSLFISLNALAQLGGSGTITFNASNNVAIQATATSLFDGGAYVYNITGNTNEAIAFGPWALPETLGEEDILFADNLSLLKNPNGSLNLLIKAERATDLAIKIYDFSGRLVSSPNPISSVNGIFTVYDPMNNQADGIYVVTIKNQDKLHSIKFIKNGGNKQPIPWFSTKNKPNIKNKTLANNYNITWSNVGGYKNGSIEVEVIEGTTNVINTTLEETVQASTEHGDVGIVPYLNGSPKTNTTITLTNTQVIDSTYTLSTTPSTTGIVFNNVYVSDDSNPTEYEITVVDNETDATFKQTIQFENIFQDENRAINGNKIIYLTDIPDEVDVTVAVRNIDNHSQMESNTTVYLYNADTDAIIGQSQTTDGSGTVTFNNVAGGTSLYTKIAKSNYYTKENRPITLVNPEFESEEAITLNVVGVPYRTYPDGSHLPGAILSDHAEDAKINLPALVGEAHMYFPPAAQRDLVISEAQAILAAIGLPPLFASDTPLVIPTQPQASSFYAYPDNRTTIDFGTNITNYTGTLTSRIISIQENGNRVILAADPFDVGGGASDMTPFQHEFFNWLGIQTNGSFPSVTDTSNTTNYFSSAENQASMPITIQLNKAHYDSTVSSGLVEYNYVQKIED